MPVPQPNLYPPFNIVRLSQVEFGVTDLAKSRAFYVDTLGLQVTDETADTIYLRAMEERGHHCIVLKKSDTPEARDLGFKGSLSTETGQDSKVLAQVAGDKANGFMSVGGASTPEIHAAMPESAKQARISEINGQINDTMTLISKLEMQKRELEQQEMKAASGGGGFSFG